MQTNLLALLVLATFFPSLAQLTGLPLTLPIAALALALIIAALYAITSRKELLPWLSTSRPFLTLILAQLVVICVNETPLTALLIPAATIFTVWTLQHTGQPWLQANRFMLSIFTCLLMWPSAAAPLPAIGLVILSLIILLSQQRVRPEETTARILLLSATTLFSPLLVIMPAIAGFSLFAVWPKRAVITAALGTTLSTAFFYFTPDSIQSLLQPDLLLPGSTLFAALALLAIVTIQSIYHWRWWPPVQHAAWMLGTLTFVLALADLGQTASFTLWYSAPLLTLSLPLVAYTLLRPTFKHR